MFNSNEAYRPIPGDLANIFHLQEEGFEAIIDLKFIQAAMILSYVISRTAVTR